MILKAFVIPALVFISCGHLNRNQQVDETTIASTDTSEADYIVKTDSVQTMSLNEIRFNGWSDKDWYDNDYFRELRSYLNLVYNGQLSNENLKSYISLLKSKFTIYKVEPFILGGLFAHIIFIDNPKQVFEAHIYSKVNESDGTIVSYEVRGIRPSDIESHFTKEQIMELLEKHPEIKLY